MRALKNHERSSSREILEIREVEVRPNPKRNAAYIEGINTSEIG